MIQVDTEQRDFASASVGRLIMKFGLPGALGMLLAGVQTIIDGLFIGRFVGTNALAAVNIVMPTYSAIIAVCVVVGVGALTVMGMSQGSGNLSKANNALRTSLIFLLLFTVVATLIFSVFSDSIVALMGADAILIADSTKYLETLSLFMPAIAITFMGDYYLRAVGKPLHGLILIASTVVFNIVLDYIFIVELGMGVFGAAAATGTAFAITTLPALYFMLKPKTGITLRSGKYEWKLLWRMAYNGSSEGVSEISAGVTQLIFNIAMMKYVGSAGVAAFATVNYIMITTILVFVGISNGLVPVISYAYGARNFRRMIAVVRANIITNSVFGIGAFFILYFSARTIISPFFTAEDSSAVEIAVAGAKILAFATLFSGANIAISSLFTAIGDAKRSVIVSALRGLVLISLGVYTLPLIFDIDGVWLSIPFAEVVTIIIASVIVANRLKIKSIRAMSRIKQN